MKCNRLSFFSCSSKASLRYANFIGIVLVLSLGLMSCGGGTTYRIPVQPNDDPVKPNPTITITPADATVTISFPDAPRTLQFSASVQNAADTKVIWQVASVPGGNKVWGTISETGLYTAPTEAPTSYTSVTAVLASDQRYSATVTLLFACDQRAALHTPEGTSVELNGRLPLVLKVEDTCHFSYPRVTWSVDGVTRGSAEAGVIVPSSEQDQVWYYPPASVPAVPVTVTAAFQDITSGTFSTQLSVTGNTQEALSLSPSELTLGLAQRQEFKLLRSGTEVPANWAVNGQERIDANSGWIIDNVYRSPYREPDTNPVIVTGTDKAVMPNRHAWAFVTIKAPGENDNSRLRGTFAMQLGGYIGTITFDGNGGISGSAETYSMWSYYAPERLQTPVTGTYTLGFDRQLVIHARYLSFGSSAPVESDWRLALISNDYAQGISPAGFLERQSVEDFNDETFAGTYVTVLRETVPCYAYICWPDGLSSDTLFPGAVRLEADGTLGGQLEAGGAPVRLAGAFTIGNAGAGTIRGATMGSEIDFAASFVAVSLNKFLIMGTTRLGTVAGTAERQIGPVSLATLRGPYIFSSGSMLGRFESDGAGNLSGVYDSGGLVMFEGYTFTENVPFSATYTVDEWGRTLVQWVGSDVTAVWYLVSPTKYRDGGSLGYAQQPLPPDEMFGRYAGSGLPWMLLDETHYAIGSYSDGQGTFSFQFVPPNEGGTGKGSIVGEIGSHPLIFPPFYIVSHDKVLFLGSEVNRIQE